PLLPAFRDLAAGADRNKAPRFARCQSGCSGLVGRLLGPAFGKRPGGFGERARLGAAIECAGRADIAVEAALVDALRDGGEAEERKHEIEGPVADRRAPGASRIGGDIALFAWN